VGDDRDDGAEAARILARLPNWPARLKAPLAAAYLGLGQTKFLAGVKTGKYPAPVLDGGNRLWRLSDLTRWVDDGGPSGPDDLVKRMRDAVQGRAASRDDDDPFTRGVREAQRAEAKGKAPRATRRGGRPPAKA
jgi:hypothetical protein